MILPPVGIGDFADAAAFDVSYEAAVSDKRDLGLAAAIFDADLGLGSMVPNGQDQARLASGVDAADAFDAALGLPSCSESNVSDKGIQGVQHGNTSDNGAANVLNEMVLRVGDLTGDLARDMKKLHSRQWTVWGALRATFSAVSRRGLPERVHRNVHFDSWEALVR